MLETPWCYDSSVCFKASPEFIKACVNNWNRNIIFGEADTMFDNCEKCGGKSVDNINIASEDTDETPKVFVGAIDGIPLYTFRPKGDRTKLEETIDSLKLEKAFGDLKERREEAKRTEELMCYIVVLETIVDALSPTYFPTSDFTKIRKTLCPDWVDQLDRIDKKTEPKM